MEAVVVPQVRFQASCGSASVQLGFTGAQNLKERGAVQDHLARQYGPNGVLVKVVAGQPTGSVRRDPLCPSIHHCHSLCPRAVVDFKFLCTESGFVMGGALLYTGYAT